MRKNFFQRLWERLRRAYWPEPGQAQPFHLDANLTQALQGMAEDAHRDPEEYANAFLADSLFQKQRLSQEILLRWQSLSPREQEITAHVCLNLTSRQIAAHLFLSQETVRTHVRTILIKFSVHSRNELRVLLREWDFRDWLKE